MRHKVQSISTIWHSQYCFSSAHLIDMGVKRTKYTLAHSAHSTHTHTHAFIHFGIATLLIYTTTILFFFCFFFRCNLQDLFMVHLGNFHSKKCGRLCVWAWKCDNLWCKGHKILCVFNFDPSDTKEWKFTHAAEVEVEVGVKSRVIIDPFVMSMKLNIWTRYQKLPWATRLLTAIFCNISITISEISCCTSLTHLPSD